MADLAQLENKLDALLSDAGRDCACAECTQRAENGITSTQELQEAASGCHVRRAVAASGLALNMEWAAVDQTIRELYTQDFEAGLALMVLVAQLAEKKILCAMSRHARFFSRPRHCLAEFCLSLAPPFSMFAVSTRNLAPSARAEAQRVVGALHEFCKAYAPTVRYGVIDFACVATLLQHPWNDGTLLLQFSGQPVDAGFECSDAVRTLRARELVTGRRFGDLAKWAAAVGMPFATTAALLLESGASPSAAASYFLANTPANEASVDAVLAQLRSFLRLGGSEALCQQCALPFLESLLRLTQLSETRGQHAAASATASGSSDGIGSETDSDTDGVVRDGGKPISLGRKHAEPSLRDQCDATALKFAIGHQLVAHCIMADRHEQALALVADLFRFSHAHLERALNAVPRSADALAKRRVFEALLEKRLLNDTPLTEHCSESLALLIALGKAETVTCALAHPDFTADMCFTRLLPIAAIVIDGLVEATSARLAAAPTSAASVREAYSKLSSLLGVLDRVLVAAMGVRASTAAAISKRQIELRRDAAHAQRQRLVQLHVVIMVALGDMQLAVSRAMEALDLSTDSLEQIKALAATMPHIDAVSRTAEQSDSAGSTRVTPALAPTPLSANSVLARVLLFISCVCASHVAMLTRPASSKGRGQPKWVVPTTPVLGALLAHNGPDGVLQILSVNKAVAPTTVAALAPLIEAAIQTSLPTPRAHGNASPAASNAASASALLLEQMRFNKLMALCALLPTYERLSEIREIATRLGVAPEYVSGYMKSIAHKVMMQHLSQIPAGTVQLLSVETMRLLLCAGQLPCVIKHISDQMEKYAASTEHVYQLLLHMKNQPTPAQVVHGVNALMGFFAEAMRRGLIANSPRFEAVQDVVRQLPPPLPGRIFSPVCSLLLECLQPDADPRLVQWIATTCVAIGHSYHQGDAASDWNSFFWTHVAPAAKRSPALCAALKDQGLDLASALDLGPLAASIAESSQTAAA